MSSMATKVDLSTRTTRSDVLNEAKPSRTYVSPLSDASNKSTDTSMFSSLIIEDTIRNPSKTLSMLNTGLKPRLSPKPFSREKPPESRKPIGEVKQHIDVPFQATTSISLSGSTRSNESERFGRRIFTSSPQASTDEDQGNKFEVLSPIVTGRRQTSPSWTPGTNNRSGSRPTTQIDENKVTSKPPITSKKPELSQQETVYPSYSRRTLSDSFDESREPGEKSVEKAKPDNIDSLAVRAQLRPKRRPVSAVFLELNEPVSDQKVAEEPRKWNRRPLSEDLTSLFESRGIGNDKEYPSEETKENRPFKKNSLNASITDEQPNVGAKERDYESDKNIFSDTKASVSGISLNTCSARMEKDKIKEMLLNKQQQIADVGENEGIMKLSENINNQALTFLTDQYDGSFGEVKKSDEIGIAPGIMKRRIGLYVANTSSSEEAEVPSNTEDKSTINTERKTRSLVSDKETKPEAQWTTSSPTVTTEFTKKFFTSPSRLDLKSEKPHEERRSSFSSQDYTAQKHKKDWQNCLLLEEKTFRPRKSSRRNDEPMQLEGSADVPKGRRDYGYKDKLNDAKTSASEEHNKYSAQVKTVKATMFEHNVEKHNPPEVYHSGNLVSMQPSRSVVMSERLWTKHESSSWLEWLSGDNVQSVSQIQKDLEIKDFKFSEKSIGTVSTSTEVGNIQRMMLPTLRKVDENKRIEPRYEVVQAVGEKVLSEYIEMAPEDKAVTLRSRRSFHNKDRELGKDGDERSKTSLQRSKSEYRKRNPLNCPQENSQGKFFSRDTDFPFERKNVFRTSKNELINTPSESLYKGENFFSSKLKTSNDGTDFDLKEKSHESKERKEKPENTLGKYSLEYSPFGIGGTGNREMKTSFNQLSDKLIGFHNSVEKDSEKGIKTVKEDPAIANSNVRDETNCLTQMKEHIKQSSVNQFHPQKGLQTKNISKEESNDFPNVMLNTEIGQIKRELYTRQSSKEADGFQRKDSKEESKEEIMVLKSKDFEIGEKIHEDMRRTSDLFRFDHEDIKRKPAEFKFPYEKKDNMDIGTVKDSSPVDKKAAYFAVTGMDSKKQRSNDVENQIGINARLTSEECYFKHNVKMGMTNSNVHSDSLTQKEKNAEKDTDTSHASKEFKSHKNVQVLQDNLKEKSEKAAERRSVIDIDALLKRHRQKLSIDDKGPSYQSAQIKPVQKSHLIEPETTQKANAKGSLLDGTYKSKVLDIDSLMADYASQRNDSENKTSDDDHNLTKWERSRSFRDSVSKGSSSKWKDPSIRLFTNDEGYKYEAVVSRYSSPQETTSTKDDLKQGLSISSTVLDNLNAFVEENHEKDPYKGKEVQGILEYSVRTLNYKSQSPQSFKSMTTESRSTSHKQSKQMLLRMSGDYQNENQVVERQHQSSSHRGPIPEEKAQPLSGGKKSAKASDLVSLMLENKEKRMEQHRSRQSVPVEPPPEPKTRHLVTLQEWRQSESKEFHKKEQLKQRAPRIQDMDVATDLSRRRSLNRHREYPISSNEDHVKQCFSRSSTSNKDTDSLVQETDKQYGTWGQDKQKPEDSIVQESSSYENISSHKQQSHSRLSSLSHTETDQHDSIIEARDGSLDRSSMDLDSTDGTASTPSFHEAKAVDFSFMDQTSVLDSTALKNRAQLSRKSQRRAPSQLQRRSRLLLSSSQLEVIEDTDSPWMFTDSTEDKPDEKDEVDEEEEKPQRSSLHSQRMPMFPGMEHSTLMAQLRKRQEAESSSESSTQPSSPQASAQPSRSPKSPLPQGTLGVKLLPTSADIQDRGASASPQWLKELKSKKRQSQYENHS